MKLLNTSRSRLLWVFLAMVIFLPACKEPDVKLVNKVKAFEPRWATLSEKMSYLDRNLSLAEKRFEQDFTEIEGMLKDIPDSLRGRNYRAMLKDYDVLIVDRDTMRTFYDANKVAMTEAVADFNAWEKRVMDAEIPVDEGLAKLKEYKTLHKGLVKDTDSLTTKLESMFGAHNKILRDVSKLMDIFTNYDIKMQ